MRRPNGSATTSTTPLSKRAARQDMLRELEIHAIQFRDRLILMSYEEEV